jgi:hypothetical protein
MMNSKYLDSRPLTSEKTLRMLATPEIDTKDSSKRPRLSFQNTKKLSKVKRKRSWKSSIDLNKQLLNLSKCLGRAKP